FLVPTKPCSCVPQRRPGGFGCRADYRRRVVEVNPEGGKMSRAAGASPQLQTGICATHDAEEAMGRRVHRRGSRLPARGETAKRVRGDGRDPALWTTTS